MRGIGDVVVNGALDRPWSQYLCDMVYTRRAFAQQYPVAIKRALRARLQAADGWALEPDGAAQVLIDKGNTGRDDYARQAMQALAHGKWREYAHEETVRFEVLRGFSAPPPSRRASKAPSQPSCRGSRRRGMNWACTSRAPKPSA